MARCEKINGLRQFNQKFHKTTKVLQGDQVMNVPLHVQDL